ncbi:hypothetical protein Clacol_006688 [Clathrus columnatus]|uniref:Dipeptidyl aminopeptidase III n=1 Tax=Clathrus columnatus TaxID=1419009 RepID=A0AAV5AHK5_9AGAM|nr:hypothetical protein Clacol_006688 [Clathrus columnatus]
MSSSSSLYLADLNAPFCGMEVAKSFGLLTANEKKYTHWINKASWAGARIIQEQWSPQGTAIYDLLIAVFSDGHRLADLQILKEKSGLANEDWEALLQYTAQIIPRISSDHFAAVVHASPSANVAVPLWEKLKEHIYALTPTASLLIGKPSNGHVSNYYPGDVITDDEVEAVQRASEKLESVDKFTLLVASANKTGPTFNTNDLEIPVNGHPLLLTVEYGDFAEPLAKAILALNHAKQYAANHHQKSALENYVKSFQTGSIEDHKEGSKHWVKDVAPVVESYIGFIESYVDPYGSRAEWEGFTAIVNKQLSAKYNTLVENAPELIKVLPWGKDYEVDAFRRPDFTALEIVNFATGSIPAGINVSISPPSHAVVELNYCQIPNYYEVRESLGFKNVSLTNILSAKAPGEKLTFVHPDDIELFNKWDSKAFEVQVANHELLGHGTGKLFTEDANGKFNFDRDNTINPLTGNKVYAKKSDVEDIQYVSFLLMTRAGLRALEYYDPIAKKHLQAHMQARMGITKFMIQQGLAKLEEVRDESGSLVDAYIRVDRQRVLTEGQEVIGKLLVELQVRKSIADGPGSKKYYTELTTPLAGWDGSIRDLVVKKRLIDDGYSRYIDLILAPQDLRTNILIVLMPLSPAKHVY